MWSDVACPWCFIGRRRLQEALARYAADDDALDVRVTYHSFELSPDTPVDYDGTEVDFLVGHRGVSREQAAQMIEQVVAIAGSVGLAYDYDAIRHTNTRRAHEVTHLALARGVQDAVVERLFQGYFEEGRHLGRDDELADLAADAGLDRQEVLDALAERRYASAVDDDVAQARAYGITGVPFFVIDRRYGVSGAQDPAVLHQGLRQAAEDRATADA